MGLLVGLLEEVEGLSEVDLVVEETNTKFV
jgi:hypothetical protein